MLKEGSGLFLGLRPADDKNMIVSIGRTAFAGAADFLAGLFAVGAGLVAYWWSR